MKSCFAWIREPVHQKLFTYLAANGGEARFVGSAVRDSFLGRPIQDFDLATTHKPSQIKALLESQSVKVIPTGIAFGTVTAVLDNTVYEITTLREDVRTDGRHAEVAFTSDWETDSKRRDFTINALYLDQEGRLFDFHEGIQDLAQGKVRFIGIPQERLQEDFLRILRFFRFSAYYAKGPLDVPALEACTTLRHHLNILSRERITHEFLRLLEAPHPWTALKAMGEGGILEILFKAPLPHEWASLLDGMGLLESQLPPSLLNPKEHALCRLKGLLPSTDPALQILLTRRQRWIWTQLLRPEADTFGDLSQEIAQRRLTPSQAAQRFIAQRLLKERKANAFPLKGNDLIALGIPEGPFLGEVLAQTRDWWGGDPPPSKEDCLVYVKEILIKKGLASPPEGEETSK